MGWRFTEETLQTIEKVRDAFLESSATKEGRINLDQLKHLFTTLDKGFTEDEVVQLYGQIDKDKSGDIDLEEFISWVFNFDAAKQIALKHKGGLHSSSVYCRIRPMATEGGHAEGEDVYMKLDGWTSNDVCVRNRHEKLDFTFPKLVITPEQTQKETFDAVMPELMDAWLLKCYNVQFLAYGQTGTGKTHTMFGTRESLCSDGPHPDWGLFPRIVHQCLEQCRVAYEIYTGKWCLLASAVEFYMTQAFDLIGDRAPVQMDAEGMPVGLATRRIQKVTDLVPFLDKVNSTRTMSKTKMNEGSSRSHCALILSFLQSDHKTDEYVMTTFTVVDLAGSERTSKTGAEAVAPTMIAPLIASGKPLTKEQQMGAEGGLINFELSMFATEVQNATDAHLAKRRYVKPRGQATTDTMRFLGRSLDGYCILAMMVCISQAPQNGWETWYSCTYGERLAHLKSPLKKMKLKDLKKELKDAQANAKKAAKEVENTPKTGSGAKWLPLREGAARATAEYLEIMQWLANKD